MIAGANGKLVGMAEAGRFEFAYCATFVPDMIEPCIVVGAVGGDFVSQPSNGAGTTDLVATRHDRRCIGTELNREYVERRCPPTLTADMGYICRGCSSPGQFYQLGAKGRMSGNLLIFLTEEPVRSATDSELCRFRANGGDVK